MGAFADTTSEGDVDKAFFPDGFDDLDEGVMDDAVGERGGANKAAFGFFDVEIGVVTGLIGLVFEVVR